jgi:hypothetical protein
VSQEEVFEREQLPPREDKVSKGDRASCEGGRCFIYDLNLHDKQASPP